jgi:hypothetical protein
VCVCVCVCAYIYPDVAGIPATGFLAERERERERVRARERERMCTPRTRCMDSMCL